jgi:hypothetical protein
MARVPRHRRPGRPTGLRGGDGGVVAGPCWVMACSPGPTSANPAPPRRRRPCARPRRVATQVPPPPCSRIPGGSAQSRAPADRSTTRHPGGATRAIPPAAVAGRRWGRTDRQPPFNNRTRPGGWLHPGHATRATRSDENTWEPLLSVGWRVGAPQEPYRLFCHRRWSRGTKGVFDPNSRVVLAIAEVLREDEVTAQ